MSSAASLAPVRFDRMLGAWLGLAIGDALGATVAFLTPDEIVRRYREHCRILGGGWLLLKPGQVTDETEQTLAIGRALLRGRGFDPRDLAHELTAWLRSGPIDVSSNTRRAIQRYIRDGSLRAPPHPGPLDTDALIRCLPVAIAVALAAAPDPAQAKRWAVAQAHFTHTNPDIDQLCGDLTGALLALFDGEGMKVLRPLSQTVNGIAQNIPRGGALSMRAAALQLKCALDGYFVTDSFRNCLIRVVNRGGEADSAGALAGMIAGATYGASAIPQGWLSKLDPGIAAEIRDQLSQFREVFAMQ